ncbi:hypothetical protein BWI17_03870 [Betaproteobacteria bacterium GR16-43]|nr:hypothetical protein BWI17_03870 [Betaproteobacteria bacterium GR16-43]
MGHFGHTGFDTDDAMDWLADFRGKYSPSRVAKALAAYEKYSTTGTTKAFTPAQIEEIVSLTVLDDIEDPPRGWKKSGLSFEAWIAKRRRDLLKHYNSGKYLNERYGPVELALAACELLVTAAGVPPAKMPLEAKRLARSARPTKKQLQRALRVAEQVAANKRYRAWRSENLKAFQGFSGGDDNMGGVADLVDRLRAIV